MGKKGANKYKYLRLPLATPEESAARREHLIQLGTIRPAAEAYSCEHGAAISGAFCPVCGNATVVWK
jgi:hypothetical protein